MSHFTSVVAGLCFSLAMLISFTVSADPRADLFDQVTGYRISNYRAPTPATVPGGTSIDITELLQLAEEGAVLIDVMPSEGAGLNPNDGTWHVGRPRRTMKGAAWMPDVGKGALSPMHEIYFASALQNLTGKDLNRAIVIFCQADCWMSWNAVKRAAALGYTRLFWYAEGTDGMRDWDVPLVVAEPLPFVRP